MPLPRAPHLSSIGNLPSHYPTQRRCYCGGFACPLTHEHMLEELSVRHLSVKCRSLLGILATIILLTGLGTSWAQSQRSELELLKREMEELRRRDEENRRRIEELQRKIETIQAAPAAKPATPESALEKAVQEVTPAPTAPSAPAIVSGQVGATRFRLIDVSADILFATGWSTEPGESLQTLQGGAHDPRKRGFTLQAVELSLGGAVDPYFYAETHITLSIDPLTGETATELEEAFLTTQSLPYGLQLKGGHFLTEFGINNPTHAHAWHWLDQPVINSRLFGGDGMRAPGVRLSWLTPLPWYSEVLIGAQNANGETVPSFLANAEVFDDRPIGGRPFTNRDVKSPKDLVYLARWVNSWNLTNEVSAKFGLSGLFGPNATGRSGYTQIYGTDLKVTWRPANNYRGWPFLLWESELLGRWYKASPFFDDSDPENIIELPKRTLVDWGFYAQALYGFYYRWSGGLRAEYAAGAAGTSVGLYNGRKTDPFRDHRFRLSPLLIFQPTEFSRIRLQYNYDEATHLEFDALGNREQNAHSVWVGFEVLIGAHPAHRY